jgi:hypothetical protein
VKQGEEERRRGWGWVAVPAAVAVVSCGTLASTGASDEGLPSAGVGPFRPLVGDELPAFAAAPFVLDDPVARYREPSVLAAGDAPGGAVWLFAVARIGGRDGIARTRADDGRAFYGDVADNVSAAHPRHDPVTVLVAAA